MVAETTVVVMVTTMILDVDGYDDIKLHGLANQEGGYGIDMKVIHCYIGKFPGYPFAAVNEQSMVASEDIRLVNYAHLLSP